MDSSMMDAATEAALANPIDTSAPLTIIIIVAATSALVELLSWLVVYRTSDYKRLVQEVESLNKKLALLRASGPSDKEAPRKKKKLDDALIKTSREFAFNVRFKTGAITFVVMFVIYRVVTSKFTGIAVATLPFDPPSFMQRVTHSSLAGTNMRECSALFIYVLCGLAVRSNVSKFFNLGPSRAISQSTLPQNVMDKDK